MNEFNETTRHDEAHAPTAAPMRTATVITGDRLCTHCGYNLTGQTIMREEQYGLLIVRCPECSQVAAATEYPMLGRWANRWAAVLAALYLLIVLVLLSATTGSIFGMCWVAGEIAGEGMAQMISDEVDAWNAAQLQAQAAPATGAAPGGTITTPTGQTIVISGMVNSGTFQQWWRTQSRSGLLQRAGGWWSALGKEAFYMWIPLLLSPLVAGCLWSVVALRRRLVGKLIIAAIIMAITAALCVIPMMVWLMSEPGWYWSAGAYVVGPHMLVISYLWAGFWLLVGLMIGRPLTRGLMRLFLPPRLRSSMALLWTADGLEPPRPV